MNEKISPKIGHGATTPLIDRDRRLCSQGARGATQIHEKIKVCSKSCCNLAINKKKRA